MTEHSTRILRARPLRLACLACLMMLALITSACHNYVANGLEALQQGRLDEAERQARAAIKDDRSDPEAQLLMARVLAQQERWAQARNFAARAVRGMPSDLDALLTYAQILEALDAPMGAADLLLDALDVNPKAVAPERLTTLLPRAIKAAQDVDKPKRVEAYILALRDAAPNAPEASDDALAEVRQRIGLKLTRQGRYSEAAQHYARLVELYPDNDELLLQQGTLLLLIQQDDAADKAFKAYVSAGDDAAARLDKVATSARVRGRDDAAERYWLQAVEANPDNPDTHLKLAGVLLERQANDDAYERLKAAIKAGKGSPQIYLQAASVAEDYGRGDLAIELLQEGSTQAAADFPVTRMLALLLLRRDRRGDMEDALRLFIDRVPEDQRQSALQKVVAWLESKRELDAAVFYLEQSLSAPGAPPEAWLKLADIEAARRRPVESVEALKKFLAASKGTVADYTEATRRATDQRLYEDAEALLKDGLRKHPRDPSLLMALANLYNSWGYDDRESQTLKAWIDTQPDTGRARFQVGARYARRGDVKRAKPILEAVANDIPARAADAWLTLGEAYQKRGMDREMRVAFENYLKASDNQEQALRTLLDKYKGPQRAADALRILDTLVKANPDDASLHMEIAKSNLAIGDPDKAMAAFEKAISLHSKPVRATRRAGQLLRRKGHQRLALALYDKLAAEIDDNPALSGELAELYWELSQQYSLKTQPRAAQFRDAARRFYKRYIEQYAVPEGPEQQPRLTALARTLVGRDQAALAMLAFDRAGVLKLKLTKREQLAKGRALLQLGRVEDAQKALRASVRGARNKNAQWLQIGRVAYEEGAWGFALQALRRVVDEGDTGNAGNAFELSLRILLRTGQKKRIQPLATAMLERDRSLLTQQNIARAYTDAGLWDLASEEYRAMLARRPNNTELMTRLASILYLANNPAKARAVLEDAADNASDNVKAWETIGDFYLSRGELKQALNAFDKAVSLGGQNPGARLRRGLALALDGQYQEANNELRAGLDKSTDPEQTLLRAFEALQMTPRHDLARDWATLAVDTSQRPEPYKQWLVSHDLQRGELARALRYLHNGEVLNQNPAQAVAWLIRAGYNLQAMELLRARITRGDGNTFSRALFPAADANARSPIQDTVLDEGGLARLPMLYRPLLEQVSGDDKPSLHEGIGLLYAEMNRPDLATIHLSAASAAGSAPSDLVLGQLHFAQGDQQKARAAFARYLQRFQGASDAYQSAALGIVSMYSLMGAIDDAEVFTRDLMNRAGRQAMMLPVMVEVLLLQQRGAEAIDLIRNGTLRPLFEASGSPDGPAADGQLGDLIAATRVLRGYGFSREAMALLRDAHKGRANNPALTLALVSLSASLEDPDAASFADAFMASENADIEGPKMALRLADAWFEGRQDSRALPLLTPLLSNPNPSLAREALQRIIALHRRTNDTAALEQALALHKKTQANTYDMLLDQGRILRNYGFYKLAAQRYEAAVKLMPGETAPYGTLVKLYALAGNPQKFQESRDRAIRAGKLSFLERVELGESISMGPDTRIAADYWETLTTRVPAMAAAQLGAARVAAYQGDRDAAVAALDAYVNASKGDPLAIGEALRLLGQLQRWEEVEPFLKRHASEALEQAAGQLDADSPLTADSLLTLGLARYAEGQREPALAAFDAYTQRAASPVGALLTVASTMPAARPDGQPEADLVRDQLIYIDRATSMAPDAPAPLLERGLARLRVDRKDQAMDDFDAWALRGGAQPAEGLQRIGQALLAKGHVQEATQPLLRLARLPGRMGLRGLPMALTAFERAGQFEAGLNFLTQHFPTLGAAPQINVDLLITVAELNFGAGNAERAAALYALGLAREPNNDTLANNLAYLLSRSGQDLERAESLARRALSLRPLDPESRSAYLDTLAWVLQKRGGQRTQEALVIQQRALRLTGDDLQWASTLFTHLAVIHESLGQSDLARESKYRARLADPRVAPLYVKTQP